MGLRCIQHLARKLPAKKLVPLHVVPVREQHLFLGPLGQKVAPVLAGLLAVTPQFLGLACVISHHKAIHLHQIGCVAASCCACTLRAVALSRGRASGLN